MNSKQSSEQPDAGLRDVVNATDVPADADANGVTPTKAPKRKGTSRWSSFLARLRRGPFLFYLILIFAVVIATSGYSYIVDFYDPTQNFITPFKHINSEYTFYTGSPGGFHIQIGNLVERRMAQDSGIQIKNVESPGPFANAINVMHTPLSFGLIQEDTLEKDDFIREKIKFVVPLYMERLHILYRRKKFEATEQDIDPPYLNIESDEATKNFFNNAVISTGPPGIGSKVFTSYLFEAAGIRPKKLESFGFEEALKKMDNDEVDVVITLAGAPLVSVLSRLFDADGQPSGRVGLVGIDPALVANVNTTFGLSLRPTTFSNKYDDFPVPTLGTYAFLIASNDVPNSVIFRLLSILKERRDELMDNLNEQLPIGWDKDFKDSLIRGGEHTPNFQLKEFEFFSAFDEEHTQFKMAMLRSFLLFVASIVTATLFVLSIVRMVLSTLLHRTYARRIVSVGQVLTNEDGEAERLVDQIKELRKIRQDIEFKVSAGTLTVSHQGTLFEDIIAAIQCRQENLWRLLNRGLGTDEGVSEKKLREFCADGYLQREEYRDLETAVAARK